MGTIFLVIKRASRASEAFSLVMKTNNCLRLCVLTRMCLHLAYTSSPGMSSTGACVLNWHVRPQLEYASSTGVCVLTGEYAFASNRHACLSKSPPHPGYAHKKSCGYHPVFNSIKILDGDCGIDRCHYGVPFKCISIRYTPEIVLASKRN